MGNASGAGVSGTAPSDLSGRRRGNSGSFDVNRANLAAGERTRFKRKHPLPSIGDRFGSLTVVAHPDRPSALVWVACDCGAPRHRVYDYNLRKGRSTACNVCAKKKTGHWIKNFWAYADIVPDDKHRRRLLNRISACINRCENEKDSAYANYGGRGIRVWSPWVKDRRAFLSYLVSLDGWELADLELDRVNVDLGYAPGNLRFVTRQQNRRNKRTVSELQRRVLELEACLRHCTCGAAKQVHDIDEPGGADSS